MKIAGPHDAARPDYAHTRRARLVARWFDHRKGIMALDIRAEVSAMRNAFDRPSGNDRRRYAGIVVVLAVLELNRQRAGLFVVAVASKKRRRKFFIHFIPLRLAR